MAGPEFACSLDARNWIEYALECLPAEVVDSFVDQLHFVCMDNADGRRLSRVTDDEFIVVAERIVPRGCCTEADRDVRYFVFAVLHEIAHAWRSHRPPNTISERENQEQESEADQLAFAWFNDYVANADRKLRPITDEEVRRAQNRSHAKMAVPVRE